jgi:hypothetical protein
MIQAEFQQLQERIEALETSRELFDHSHVGRAVDLPIEQRGPGPEGW